MSDVLVSSRPQDLPGLVAALRSFADEGPTTPVTTFQGAWGCMAVTPTPYRGCFPIDDGGGPLVALGGFAFRSPPPSSPRNGDDDALTRRLLDRLRRGDPVAWTSELVGSFLVVSVDAATGTVQVVTDPLAAVPAYETRIPCADGPPRTLLGSHPDALAQAAGLAGRLDPVSCAEFFLSNTVTHPHTLYSDLRQLDPASVTRWGPGSVREVTQYWTPREPDEPPAFHEAAAALREALDEAVAAMIRGKTRIACFLSAGEDTRVVASLLPPDRATTLTMAPVPNRETELAALVAQALGLPHRIFQVPPRAYVDALPRAVCTVGSGGLFRHAATLGLPPSADLGGYDAVLGGYGSDTLCKGAYTITRTFLVHTLSVVPGVVRHGAVDASLPLHPDVLSAVASRRRARLQHLASLRPLSYAEWCGFWPAPSLMAHAAVLAQRRTMASFEPFMSPRVVALMALVPTPAKLNRRLFHEAFRDHFQKTRHVPHGLGYHPGGNDVLNGLRELACRSTRALRAAFSHLAGRGPLQDGSWPNPSRILACLDDHHRDAITSLPSLLPPGVFSGPLDPSALGGRRPGVLFLLRCLHLAALRSRSGP